MRSDLRDRIIQFIGDEPGSSTTAVRKAVSARSSHVSEALEALESADEIRNRGNGRGHRWHLVGEDSGGDFEHPDEVPDHFPAYIEGVKVTRWTSRKITAMSLSISARQLDRYGPKGLPSYGQGKQRRYPWPHCLIWQSQYLIEKKRSGTGVAKLSMKKAILEDRTLWLEIFGEPRFAPEYLEEGAA